MKILFIAYKIEEGKGSEDATSYHLLPYLNQDDVSITLLSRSNNIEKLRHDPKYQNIEMISVDVPASLSWFKKGKRGIILYYYLWQIFCGLKIRALLRLQTFNIIHQYNFHATWCAHFIPKSSAKIFIALSQCIKEFLMIAGTVRISLK